VRTLYTLALLVEMAPFLVLVIGFGAIALDEFLHKFDN
jgi:hypothetical protein